MQVGAWVPTADVIAQVPTVGVSYIDRHMYTTCLTPCYVQSYVYCVFFKLVLQLFLKGNVMRMCCLD